MAKVARVTHGSPPPRSPPRKRGANDDGEKTTKRKKKTRSDTTEGDEATGDNIDKQANSDGGGNTSATGGNADDDKATLGTEALGKNDGERIERCAIDSGNTLSANDGSPGNLEESTKEATDTGGEPGNDEDNATTLQQEADKVDHNKMVGPNYQTPVRNTSVSKNGFFQSGKTLQSNDKISRHISS